MESWSKKGKEGEQKLKVEEDKTYREIKGNVGIKKNMEDMRGI